MIDFQEQKWIDSARKGDQDAFAELVHLYEKKVFALTARMCKNPEDAAEAAQEAFLAAWQGLPNFRGDAAFSTWLYRLASNACIDLLRREGRHQSAAGPSFNDEETGLEVIDTAPTPSETLERKELREQIELGLQSLSTEHRQVLILREIHQLSYDEISRINKKMGKDVVFGVSPQGQIQNLYVKNSLYCDVKKWMSEKGYIDYVCPQVYWSFSQKIAPFDKMVDDWSNCKKRKSVSLYIGMAAYRAGISKQEANTLGDPGWSKSNTVLKREVQYIRNKSNISGFFLYRYDNIVSTTAKKEIKNLLTILK